MDGNLHVPNHWAFESGTVASNVKVHAICVYLESSSWSTA